MPMSNTKRAINYLIYAALFAFVTHFSGPAFSHIDRASSAVSTLQAR